MNEEYNLIDNHFHKRHDLHLYKIHTRFVLTQKKERERKKKK